MAVLLAARRVLVTAAPGTGSTSLREHLLAQPDAVDLAPVGRLGGDGKHQTLAQLEQQGWSPPGGPPTVVTTTRNPFDHWAAEWHRSRTRWAPLISDRDSWVHAVPGAVQRIQDAVDLTFHDWVEQSIGQAARNGCRRHLNPGHVAEAHVVLRMEHLAEDLEGVLPDLVGELPRLNVTDRRRDHREVFDSTTREIVEAVHRPDLERFGYAF